MTSARERHIQQAQIFLLPLELGSFQRLAIGRELQPSQRNAVFDHPGAHKLREARGDGTMVRGKRQQHHRVFEPLRFVDGDDTH
jgi:hypothetical protein